MSNKKILNKKKKIIFFNRLLYFEKDIIKAKKYFKKIANIKIKKCKGNKKYIYVEIELKNNGNMIKEIDKEFGNYVLAVMKNSGKF